jgi:hypothetical protein
VRLAGAGRPEPWCGLNRPLEATLVNYDAILVPRPLLARASEALGGDTGSKMQAFITRWGALIGRPPDGRGRPTGGPVSAAKIRAGAFKDHDLFVPHEPPVLLLHPLGTRLAAQPVYAWEPLADGSLAGRKIDYPAPTLDDLPPPVPVASTSTPPAPSRRPTPPQLSPKEAE